MPSAWPSVVADTSGAAARMSIAAAARELRRRPATAARGGEPVAFELRQQRQPVRGLVGQRGEKMSDPFLARPRDLGAERGGAGQERAGQGGHPAALPIPGEGGANRRPLAAADRARRGPRRPRRAVANARRRPSRNGPPRARSPRAGPRPARKTTGRARRHAARRRTTAAVDQRRHMIEAQAHPFDQRGQVPRDRSPGRRPRPGGGPRRGGRARPRPGAAGGRRAPNRGGRSCRRRVRERAASATDRRGGGFCRVSAISIGDLGKATSGSWYRLWRSFRLGRNTARFIGSEPRVISQRLTIGCFPAVICSDLADRA